MSIHQTVTIPLDGCRLVVSRLGENLRRTISICYGTVARQRPTVARQRPTVARQRPTVSRQRSVVFGKRWRAFRTMDVLQRDGHVRVLFGRHIVRTGGKGRFGAFQIVMADGGGDGAP